MRCLACLFALIFFCVNSSAWAQESSALEQYFKQYLEQAFAMRRWKRLPGDHRFDGQLDDISAEARAIG
ncbi:MAG: hypothetical protein U0930_16040 [Pirellulales bacterium]